MAALQQLALQDPGQLQAQENHSTAGPREGWGARLFSRLPTAVLGVGAVIIAGVAWEGVENKKPRAKDNQLTDQVLWRKGDSA